MGFQPGLALYEMVVCCLYAAKTNGIYKYIYMCLIKGTYIKEVLSVIKDSTWALKNGVVM